MTSQETRDKDAARRVLGSMPALGREVLTRSYLKEQPADQICSELSITYAEFANIKEKARADFERMRGHKLPQGYVL